MMSETSPAAGGGGPLDPHKQDSGASDEPADTGAPTDTEPKVGYGKPPMVTRFKNSGNLKGRPKGSKNRKTIVREVAGEMHTVVENGKKRRRSTLELMLLALRNRAMAGDVRAIREFDRISTKHAPQNKSSKTGVLVAPAPMTIEEAIAEGEIANAKAEAERAAQQAKEPGTGTPL